MSGADEPGRPAVAAGARSPLHGPWLLLPPLAVLGVGIAYAVLRPGSAPEGSSAPSLVAGDPAERRPDAVDGFEGVLELGDGDRLRARLSPLHAEPERRAHDVPRLAERLDLPAGEPWRLELAWEAGGERGGSTPEALPLAELRVRDAGGQELVPLAALLGERAEAAAGAALPLYTLLARPAEPLRAGSERVVLLWGSAPRPPLRVGPLAGKDPAGPASIELRARALPRADLPGHLARLEPGAPPPTDSPERHDDVPTEPSDGPRR